MLTFTDKALEMVKSYMEQAGADAEALRISRQDGSPLAPNYDLTLVAAGEEGPEDVKIEVNGLTVLVAGSSSAHLDGATVDFVERVNERGFEVRPVSKPEAAVGETLTREPPAGPLADQVRELLSTQVNPAIAAHGGAISLVDVDGSEIYLEMSGGCQGCAMSRMTLRQGVERMIRQHLPEITMVHDVTDHASGENPYFSG